MKELFECEVCHKQYNNKRKSGKCEQKHELIKQQVIVLTKEIAKLYRIGGTIEITLGSSSYHTMNRMGLDGSKNCLRMKDWTIGTTGNDYFVPDDTWNPIKIKLFGKKNKHKES